MKAITSLKEYLEIEQQADRLYEKPHRQEELNKLLDLMSLYEEAHPEEISQIYGDETNLPDTEGTFENEIYPWQGPEDY